MVDIDARFITITIAMNVFCESQPPIFELPSDNMMAKSLIIDINLVFTFSVIVFPVHQSIVIILGAIYFLRETANNI